MTCSISRMVASSSSPSFLQQRDHFLRAATAGRALAAAFMFEEFQRVQHRVLDVVLIGQNHHGMGADKGAEFSQFAAKIERNVIHRCRQYAAGCAAWIIGLERMAICHAAAIIIDQFADGDAGRREDDARLFHTAGDGP